MIFNDPLRCSYSSFVSMSKKVSKKDLPTISATSSDEGNAIFCMADVGNMHFRDEENNKQTNYCRSYSVKFIDLISRLECTVCSEVKLEKFTSDNPPMIARCGHYIHKNCCLDGSISKCYICKAIVKEPLQDEVLADFFKAIDEDLYRCTGACEQLHDLTNLVVFPDFDKNNKIARCVWCAANSENKDLKQCKASLARKGHDATMLQKDSFLNSKLLSLDRNTHVSGWALDACCLCMKELRTDKDTDIVHLPCNHIGHNKCVPKKNDGKVQCKLCKSSSPTEKTFLKDRKWLGKHYLKGYTKDNWKRCEKCNQTHPRSNFPKKLPDPKCVWCEVEEFGPGRKKTPDVEYL